MIPTALTERDKWVCWRYDERNGKATKVPIGAAQPTEGPVDPTDSINWSDYETAAQTADYYDHLDGIGYVFHAGGRIVGIDLDDCRVPATGTITDDAQAIINWLDSYTEVSPSGTGLHIYVFAGDGVPDGANRSGDVEMYDSARFFTVTGDHVEGTETSLKERQAELTAVNGEYILDDDSGASDSPPAGPATASDPSQFGDRKLVEKAHDLDNDVPFADLWRGRWEPHYDSHSEARLSFYNPLAFLTHGDETQMWRVFTDSGLYPHPDPSKRPKCDRLKDREISKAIRDCNSFYSGSFKADKLPDDGKEVHADGGRLIVSDPTTLGVVEALEDLGTASTKEITDHPSVDRKLRQVQNAISYLIDTGAVEWDPDGRSTTYSLTD